MEGSHFLDYIKRVSPDTFIFISQHLLAAASPLRVKAKYVETVEDGLLQVGQL